MDVQPNFFEEDCEKSQIDVCCQNETILICELQKVMN